MEKQEKVDKLMKDFLNELGSFQTKEVSEEEMLLFEAKGELVQSVTDEEKMEGYLNNCKDALNNLNNLKTDEQKSQFLALAVVSGIAEALAGLDYMTRIQENQGEDREIPIEFFDEIYGEFKKIQKELLSKLATSLGEL